MTYNTIDTPLHIAAREGNLSAIQESIKKGADLEARASKHVLHGPLCCALTPLMEAAQSPLAGVEVLQALLEAGSSLKAKSEAGVTAFYYACLSGNAEKVRFLLDRGGRADEETLNGRTALMAAAGDYGIPNGRKPNAKSVRLLLTNGATVSARDCVGRTALHVAAEAGSAECAEALITAGAEVDARDSMGETPLMQASSAKVARVLIGKGADWSATAGKKQDLADLLKETGVELPSGFTLPQGLKFPTTPGYTKVFEKGDGILALLEAGLDLQTCDEFGRPLLELACSAGNTEAVEVLLQAGADPSHLSSQNETLLHVAAASLEASAALFELLARKGGLSPNSVTPEGHTPLTLAAEHGNAVAVEVLLTLGADPHHRVHGKTALEIAREGEKQPPDKSGTEHHIAASRLGEPLWLQLQEQIRRMTPTQDCDAAARQLVSRFGKDLLQWEQESLFGIVEAQLRGQPVESPLSNEIRQRMNRVIRLLETAH